jgi:hypothetical protein
VKFAEIVQIIGQLFPRKKVMHEFSPKNGWATFWEMFSQTHLVTLEGIELDLGELPRF